MQFEGLRLQKLTNKSTFGLILMIEFFIAYN